MKHLLDAADLCCESTADLQANLLKSESSFHLEARLWGDQEEALRLEVDRTKEAIDQAQRKKQHYMTQRSEYQKRCRQLIHKWMSSPSLSSCDPKEFLSHDLRDFYTAHIESPDGTSSVLQQLTFIGDPDVCDSPRTPQVLKSRSNSSRDCAVVEAYETSVGDVEDTYCSPAVVRNLFRPKFSDTESSLLHQFDAPKKMEMRHKHREAVRGKKSREDLHGDECEHCQKFYDAVGFTHSQRAAHIQNGSRHRHPVGSTPPLTPEGYWDVDLLHTQRGSCLKKARPSFFRCGVVCSGLFFFMYTGTQSCIGRVRQQIMVCHFR
jgi:hypothetical protein